MNAVRWGILSVSRHYSLRVHQGLIGMPCLTVAGIASRDLQKAKAEAYTLCIPKSYGSYDELLADPDIDAVFNVLPNHLHAEWTIKALQRGKHVLCEKPFAMNAAQVASMIDVAEKKQVPANGSIYVSLSSPVGDGKKYCTRRRDRGCSCHTYFLLF